MITTERYAHGTPEAGTRTQYARCVGRGEQAAGYLPHPAASKPPCASGTYSTREAGTRSLCARYGGAGAYVSAQREASIVLIVLRPPCKGSAERK